MRRVVALAARVQLDHAAHLGGAEEVAAREAVVGAVVAAPQVTRALARYFLTVPEAARSLDAERQFLTGTADWDTPDMRMGNGALRG